MHFIGQLQYYLMFEVLESSWTSLVQRLSRRGPDLDEIVDAHENYLTMIQVKSTLLVPGHKGESLYHQKVQLVLQEMNSFRHTHVSLRIPPSGKAIADSVCPFLRND